jgi:citrate lyase subunit beta / citryl-CoA lyase
MNAVDRSLLFVPADRPERFAKALACGSDAVIIDLEDAVAPDRKDTAREILRQWLATTAANEKRSVIVRINAVDTAWFADDAALCQSLHIAAVMLSKTERADDLRRVDGVAKIIPLIESAAGFAAIRSTAAAPNVVRLAFGAIDFQLDMNMQANREELMIYRSEFVLASRLAGIEPPIDSPSTSIDDIESVQAEALHAHRMGFGGKLCIHPRQVDAVNQSFMPSEAEATWARRVIEIADSAQGAATTVDGKMVDKPVVLRAMSILRALDRPRPA